MFSRSIKVLDDYKANRDPLAVLANTVAPVVAGNQRFYPLYLDAIVGRAAWPACIDKISKVGEGGRSLESDRVEQGNMVQRFALPEE
jgi:hypothetical protein